MKPGDQYPQAVALAETIFEEALDDYAEQYGSRPEPDTSLYQDLKKQYVPPYDPGKFPNKWWKLIPDSPSRTVTAHLGKDTYTHIHYDSAQARVISVREAARLQSFPDGFRFSGGMGAAFRQIGNAVPPLLAYALAKQIHYQLEPFLNVEKTEPTTTRKTNRK
jgi:DNA (cytosine-5)-methyltransferase 1